MSPSRARRSSPSRFEWLGLSEASGLLGVSPVTLRRWADAGRVRSFTTPGGHRRFARRTLERLLPADREHRPPTAVMGLTPGRVTTVYRRFNRGASLRLPWVVALADEDREAFRELGSAVAVRLLGYLDAVTPEEREHQIHGAKVHAAAYGSRSALLGLSLTQGVEAFLRFRAPFVAELAAVAPRRGLHAAEATELLQTAEHAMDLLLIAMMSGHSVAAAARIATQQAR